MIVPDPARREPMHTGVVWYPVAFSHGQVVAALPEAHEPPKREAGQPAPFPPAGDASADTPASSPVVSSRILSSSASARAVEYGCERSASQPRTPASAAHKARRPDATARRRGRSARRRRCRS